MTRTGGTPPGMPPHLWELAQRDVRAALPERLRRARASGAEAPAAVRRVARRAAQIGASAGAVAAAVVLGQGAAGAGDVTLTGGSTPFDGAGAHGGHAAPAHAGAGGSGPHDPTGGHAANGGAGHGGPGPDGVGHDGADVVGGAATTSSGSLADGPVGSGVGTSFRVHEGGAPGSEDWLDISIFQDVSVTETADGMFLVQAVQVVVIRDDDGHEYVFKEIHQVTVPDPPGEETDVVVVESGYVHVVENPDGSFTPVTSDYELEVTFGADGDGLDEVTIDQDAVVRLTDREDVPDDDVSVVLTSRAVSTSDDTGDEAASTIFQDQVLLDGEAPPGEAAAVVVHDDPFGPPALTEADGRSQGPGSSGTTSSGTGTTSGTASPTSPGTTVPAAGPLSAPVVTASTLPVVSPRDEPLGSRAPGLDDVWGRGGDPAPPDAEFAGADGGAPGPPDPPGTHHDDVGGGLGGAPGTVGTVPPTTGPATDGPGTTDPFGAGGATGPPGSVDPAPAGTADDGGTGSDRIDETGVDGTGGAETGVDDGGFQEPAPEDRSVGDDDSADRGFEESGPEDGGTRDAEDAGSGGQDDVSALPV